MTKRDLLIEQIKKLAIVHGRVRLASGKEADYYVDLRRVTLDGVAAPLVGAVMRDLVADWHFEAVGGLTLGADPVAVAMLHDAAQTGTRLDAFVVRKDAKAHGLQRRIEGTEVAGRRCLVVEDTSTTGGSVMTAVEAVRQAGPAPAPRASRPAALGRRAASSSSRRWRVSFSTMPPGCSRATSRS